ncbi:unnamed protein product [Caretta caretta]
MPALFPLHYTLAAPIEFSPAGICETENKYGTVKVTGTILLNSGVDRTGPMLKMYQLKKKSNNYQISESIDGLFFLCLLCTKHKRNLPCSELNSPKV